MLANRFTLLFWAILACFTCFSPENLTAQSARVQQLEQELVSASGAARAQKLIDLSDANFQAGLYDLAAKRAEEATDFAKKLRLPELRATALNRQGKAFAAAGKKGIFGKNKAVGKFNDSNDILRETHSANSALYLDNLEGLRREAEKAGKSDDLARITAEISRVKSGGNLASPVAGTGDAGAASKTELQKELTRLEQEKQALDAKLQNQVAEASTAGKQSAEMAAALKNQLAAKEAAVAQMSQEQMRTELLLNEQKQLVDSMAFKSSLDSINLLNKDLAVKEAKSSRNFLLAAAAALLLLLGGSVFSYLNARKHTAAIRIEQKRSEDLLLNILPALVAKELKKQGFTEPQFHDDVAVLFADFVGFSKIAEKLPPAILIRELDTCFKAFDEIVQRHELEKIKTIGDAYMAASGLSGDKTDSRHLYNMVMAAHEMQQWLADWNIMRMRQKLPRFDARIGIHSGPVVAGVVGSKKFAYDIWGDTVNIAARVEQAGEGVFPRRVSRGD